MAIAFPFDHIAADWGLTDNVEADVEEHKLGDGFVLRMPNGINYIRESWNPKYSHLSKAEADAMYSWLKTRLKLTPFMWLHPETKNMHKVICKSVSRVTSDIDIHVVSMTLEEDFNP